MYIESYLVWGAVIWIIYLLYRTYKWSKAFDDLDRILTELKKKKSIECRSLWREIEMFNKSALPKMSVQKRSSILRQEASAILAIAENATYVEEYLPGTTNGATVTLEGSAYARIDSFFGSETELLSDDEERIQSIYTQLNEHIYEK